MFSSSLWIVTSLEAQVIGQGSQGSDTDLIDLLSIGSYFERETEKREERDRERELFSFIDAIDGFHYKLKWQSKKTYN